MIVRHVWICVIAFVSIVIHEAAHALASAALGQVPYCIEITPIGAALRMEDEYLLPPLRRVLVLLAGPTVTMVLCCLAAICTTCCWINCETGRFIFVSNLCILMINLLPVLPLDGGRLLVLLLEGFFPQRIVSCIMKIIGSMMGALMIVLNLISCWYWGGWNLSLALTGCCMIYCTATAQTTRAVSELRSFLDRKIQLEKKMVLRTVVMTCLHTTPILRLVQRLPSRAYALFVCLEAGSQRVLGCVDESCLIQHYLTSPQDEIAACINKDANNGKWDKFGTK